MINPEEWIFSAQAEDAPLMQVIDTNALGIVCMGSYSGGDYIPTEVVSWIDYSRQEYVTQLVRDGVVVQENRESRASMYARADSPILTGTRALVRVSADYRNDSPAFVLPDATAPVLPGISQRDIDLDHRPTAAPAAPAAPKLDFDEPPAMSPPIIDNSAQDRQAPALREMADAISNVLTDFRVSR